MFNKDVVFIFGLNLCVFSFVLGAIPCLFLLACGKRCVGCGLERVDSLMADGGLDLSKTPFDGHGSNITTITATLGLMARTSGLPGFGPFCVVFIK